MPRSLPSSLARGTTRRRRRKRHQNKKPRNSLRRKRIHLRKCPKEPLILKNGSDSTLTMMNPSPWPGFGNTLTMRTTPFGGETTSTMTSSPWSSCPVTSSEACSRGWTNSTRTPLLQFVCLAKTMTAPSLAFGLDDNWQVDYEGYNWSKLDSKSEECKKLVDQYWKWEGTDEKGRKFNQGKIFK